MGHDENVEGHSDRLEQREDHDEQRRRTLGGPWTRSFAERDIDEHDDCPAVCGICDRPHGLKPPAYRSVQSTVDGIVPDAFIAVVYEFVDGFRAWNICGCTS